MRPLPKCRRTGRLLERRGPRRMIAMGVSDDDMRHRLAAYGIEQRRRVARINGARVDDRDPAVADDVAQRPLEGERPRIVGQDAPHARRDVVDDPRSEIERAIEREVFGHATLMFELPDGGISPSECAKIGRREASPSLRSPGRGAASHQGASAFAAVATVSTRAMMFFRTALFWICRNALMSRKPSLSSGTSNCSATATSMPASPEAEKKYVTGTSSIFEIS